jgi:hypothetical protein
MTQGEIIEMAEKAGLAFGSDEYPDIWQTYMYVGKKEIVAFAKLIAEAEREAFKQIIRETPFSNWFQADVIEAIDKRGQA